MKKILVLITILGFMASGCSNCDDKRTEEIPPMDWTKYKSISKDEVVAAAKHYGELVSKDPKIGIQQINMDGAVLEALLFNTEGIKLIAGADINTNAVTMYMEFWRRGIFSFYDINSFFNSSQPGMRGQPPICPPPAGCELPFSRSSNPEVISEGDVTKMAALYNNIVERDPSLAMQQITMDGLILELVLGKAEGLKLIAAADLGTSETTVVMQFWKDKEFSYYDIRDIFYPAMRGMRNQQPLCPPPAACDIP